MIADAAIITWYGNDYWFLRHPAIILLSSSQYWPAAGDDNLSCMFLTLCLINVHFSIIFCDFLCEGVFSGFQTTSSGIYVPVLLFLLTNHITSDHSMSIKIRKPDMEFVQKFTPPDFQFKNFTPPILPNFNSFSKKKTQ